MATQDINVIFCRTLLAQTMEAVRPHTTAEQRKAAWVWTTDRKRGHWEFHGPDEFYAEFRADNAYDARAKGWSKWLAEMGYEE